MTSMKINTLQRARHYYITRHGISQDAVNKILRPGKRRFAGSKKKNPQEYMKVVSKRELRKYRSPNNFRYQFYFSWDPELGPWDKCVDGIYTSWVLRINRRVPPLGPRVRLVDMDGEPIVSVLESERRTKKRNRKRNITSRVQEVQESFSTQEELENAFLLMDSVFDLLELHHKVYDHNQARPGQAVHGPFAQIKCRDGSSYQSCNFSRFVPIWLVYINALNPQGYLDSAVTVSLGFDEVSLKFKSKNLKKPINLEDSSSRLGLYQARVYDIIHSGYNVLKDTIEVPLSKEKFVDGVHIFTRPVIDDDTAKTLGYCPDLPFLNNSEYMADYIQPFSDQIKKWLGQHSCVNLRQEPNYLRSPASGQLQCKMTIEPAKPRLCYNARPLAGVMKRLPCKLDDLGVLLPLLEKGMYGCVSDDKQGNIRNGNGFHNQNDPSEAQVASGNLR